MKRLVYRSLSKWIYLVVLGLIMYILGFIVAQIEQHRKEQARFPSSVPTQSETRSLEKPDKNL